MRSGFIRTIGILLIFVAGLVTPARTDGPSPDLKLLADETAQSPDHTLSIQQGDQRLTVLRDPRKVGNPPDRAGKG